MAIFPLRAGREARVARVRPTELPWRRPRHELLLLALVAIAALTLVYPAGAQDDSRMCLTDAVLHGHLHNDACLEGSIDVANYGGHRYSDKAPGVSFLSVPAAAIVHLGPPPAWQHDRDLGLWATRISTGGIALLLCAFLLGRVAEGLVPGAGGLTLIAYALGTETAALAVANFGHVQAGALAFSAFVLAWGRRPLPAGLAAGAAMLTEYEAGLVVLVLGAYVLLRGARPLARFALGVAPAVLVLGAYDRAAFGSPFHLSYRYVSDKFAKQQSAGFFGIHMPRGHAIALLLTGNRGLLFDSAILVAAAVGLILLRRRIPAEAIVCAVVVVAFFALDAGYFDPYGGDSPGGRFFAPAIPFLAVGIPAVVARSRGVAVALLAASVLASTSIALTWPTAVNSAPVYTGTVWRRLDELAQHGASAPLARWAQPTVLPFRPFGAFVVVLIVALTTVAVSWPRRPDAGSRAV